MKEKELSLLEKLRKELSEFEEEVWKPVFINDTKTTYVCSNFGNIANTKFGFKLLKPSKQPNGYYRVVLHVDGKAIDSYVHRIIGKAFVKIPKKYKKLGLTFDELEVNHKDGKKWNNTSSNLEWVTSTENHVHAYKTGLNIHKGEKSHFNKYTKNQIIQVCELLVQDKLKPSEISKITGVSVGQIHDIKNYGAWTDITKNYDFSKCRDKQKVYSDEAISEMKKLLNEGKLSCREIADKTNIRIKTIYWYRNKLKKEKQLVSSTTRES